MNKQLSDKEKISIVFGSVNFDNWTIMLNKLENYVVTHVNIKNIINKYVKKKDILIVFSYSDIELLSKNNNCNKLRPYFNYILTPNYNTVKLLDNHRSFSNYIIKNNLGNLIPKIYNDDNIEYPCILKQNSNSFGGYNTYIIYNEIELKQKINNSSDWIIKELIMDKTEYVTHILAINGQIIHSVTYGTIFNNDCHIKRGASDVHIRDDHCHFFTNIFRLLNYTGFACVDYKMKDGKPKIFEINPRPGGSLIAETKDFEIMLNKLAHALPAQ